MYVEVLEVRNAIQSSAINNIIRNEFITDDAEKESKIAEIIEAVIIDAGAEIDGYINRRYSTPLQVVPKVISKICKDIAVYNLMLRQGIKQGSDSEAYYNQYKQDIKYLENVAKGIIDIGISNENTSSDNVIGEFRINSNKRIFSRNSLKGF